MNIFLYLFTGLLIIFIQNSLANVLLSFFTNLNKDRFTIFTANILSLLLVVFSFALVKSSCNSILLGILPVLFAVYKFILYKYNFSFHLIRFNFEGFLKSSLIYSFFFLFQLFFILDFNTFGIKSFFSDYHLYGLFSDNLRLNGIESSQIANSILLKNEIKSLHPYHYLDLWLNALATSINSLASSMNYYLVTIPIFITLFFTGILSLFKSNNSDGRRKNLVIAFLLLFVSVCFFPIINSINELKYLSETSILGVFNTKNGIAFSMFLVIIYNYEKNRLVSWLFLLLLPFINISFLPTIYGSLGISLIYNLIKRKYIKDSIITLCLLCFNFIFFITFYNVNSSTSANQSTSLLFDLRFLQRISQVWDSSVGIKANISNFIVYQIPMLGNYFWGIIKNLVTGLIFFTPFLLIFFTEIKKQAALMKFISLILIVGLLVVIVTDGIIDNYQFFSNSTLIISILFIFLYFQIEVVKKKYITLLIIIICNFLPILSQKGIYTNSKNINLQNKLNQISITDKNNYILVLCFVSNDSLYNSRVNSWLYSVKLLNYMNEVAKPFIFILANPEILEGDKLTNSERKYIDNLPINLLKKKNKSFSISRLIREYDIKYIYLNEEVKLPNEIKKINLKDCIQFSDHDKLLHINGSK